MQVVPKMADFCQRSLHKVKDLNVGGVGGQNVIDNVVCERLLMWKLKSVPFIKNLFFQRWSKISFDEICFFFRRTSENRRTRSYQLFTHNRDNSTLSKDYGIGLRAFEDSRHIHITKDLVRRNWSLLYLPDLWQILSCCYDPSK